MYKDDEQPLAENGGGDQREDYTGPYFYEASWTELNDSTDLSQRKRMTAAEAIKRHRENMAEMDARHAANDLKWARADDSLYDRKETEVYDYDSPDKVTGVTVWKLDEVIEEQPDLTHIVWMWMPLNKDLRCAFRPSDVEWLEKLVEILKST